MSDTQELDTHDTPIELGDAILDKLVSDLQKIEDTTREVQSSGQINQDVVASVESYFPGLLTDSYPAGGYTEHMSSVNVSVALEELTTKAKILIGAIIAAFLGLLVKILSWMFGAEESGKGNGGGGGKDDRPAKTKKDVEVKLQNELQKEKEHILKTQEKIVKEEEKIEEIKKKIEANTHKGPVPSTFVELLEKHELEQFKEITGTDGRTDILHIGPVKGLHLKIFEGHVDRLSPKLSPFLAHRVEEYAWLPLLTNFSNSLMEDTYEALMDITKRIMATTRDLYPPIPVVKEDSRIVHFLAECRKTLDPSQHKGLSEYGIISRVDTAVRNMLSSKDRIVPQTDINSMLDVKSTQGVESTFERLNRDLHQYRLIYSYNPRFAETLQRELKEVKKIQTSFSHIVPQLMKQTITDEQVAEVKKREKEYNKQIRDLQEVWNIMIKLFALRRFVFRILTKDEVEIFHAIRTLQSDEKRFIELLHKCYKRHYDLEEQQGIHRGVP